MVLLIGFLNVTRLQLFKETQTSLNSKVIQKTLFTFYLMIAWTAPQPLRFQLSNPAYRSCQHPIESVFNWSSDFISFQAGSTGVMTVKTVLGGQRFRFTTAWFQQELC